MGEAGEIFSILATAFWVGLFVNSFGLLKNALWLAQYSKGRTADLKTAALMKEKLQENIFIFPPFSRKIIKDIEKWEKEYLKRNLR